MVTEFQHILVVKLCRQEGGTNFTGRPCLALESNRTCPWFYDPPRKVRYPRRTDDLPDRRGIWHRQGSQNAVSSSRQNNGGYRMECVGSQLKACTLWIRFSFMVRSMQAVFNKRLYSCFYFFVKDAVPYGIVAFDYGTYCPERFPPICRFLGCSCLGIRESTFEFRRKRSLPKRDDPALAKPWLRDEPRKSRQSCRPFRLLPHKGPYRDIFLSKVLFYCTRYS